MRLTRETEPQTALKQVPAQRDMEKATGPRRYPRSQPPLSLRHALCIYLPDRGYDEALE